jgi:hypothetical protein
MIAFLGLTLMIVFSTWAFAATQSTQTVSFQVAGIDAISTNGDNVSLVINSAVAGSDLTSVTDSSTTYSITTNGVSKKITGSLSDDMPANTSLMVNLAAPNGANSLGSVALTKNPKDLVNGISKIAADRKTITYTFNASVAAGVINATTRKVTLTIVD